MPAIAVIIPVLNEAGNIRRLAEEARRAVEAFIIVADNGSSDATAAEALAGGALVVEEARRGYGYACEAGARRALEMGAEILAFIDGDYSYLPSELPAVLAPVMEGRADLCLGSRWLGRGTSLGRDTRVARGSRPPRQRLGTWLTARLMRRLYGLKLTDLGPVRAICADLLTTLDMREMTYGWPAEMLVKCARRGARIVEVPVSYQDRQWGQSKVGGTVRGTLLAARYILAVTMRYARR